ncbi:Lipoprotein [Cupriavidus sp. H18C1]|uniref:hypothetical protein n=1 Tax=Cupriavidus sp. H18C1 TaxID=3241601 RepID=UPI003BB934FA
MKALKSIGRWLALGAAGALLTACVILQPVQEAQKLIGAPESTVRATFGEPTDIYRLDDGTVRWIYSKQPLGRQAYAADFDTSGKLTRFRQMLTTTELYKARIGTWTKRDVAEHFGLPREPTQYFPLMRRDVWSYRFLHEENWPSLFHFYFDDAGVLRQTQITPDPLADPRETIR